jgi:hypothetical protein
MDTDHHDPAGSVPVDLADLVGVVRVGRRAYASSLIWNTAADQASLLAEARESAARLGSELMCLYRINADTLPQYGLGDVLIGHRPGLPSLAAAIGAASGGAVYGVWPTDEGAWVVLGIRADASVVYDKAFRQEAQARAEFYDGLATEVWSEIVCPPGWRFDGATPSDALAERFHSARVKLRVVRPNVPRMVFFATLAVAMLAVGAYFYRQALKPPPPLSPIPTVVQIPPMPWIGQPRPSEMLLTCVGGLWGGMAAAAGIPGWLAGPVGHCNGKTVSYDISLQGGTANWLRSYSKDVPGAPVVGNLRDGHATLTWRLPPVSVYAAGSLGIGLDRAQMYLRSHFAELHIPLTIMPIKSEMFWRTFQYKFTTQFSPDTFTPVLGKVPGSVIRSISFDSAGKNWTVSGEVYERLPPPSPQSPPPQSR